MTKLLAVLSATAALVLAVPAAAQDRHERAERAFAELVEGHEVAGDPERCVSAFNSNDIRVVEHVGIVVERGDTLWVARARNPNQIDHWDVPIIDRFGTSRLCSTDVMRTIDRGSGIFTGVLFLDDFVPYRETAEG